MEVVIVNQDKIEADLALFPAKANRIYRLAVREAGQTLADETKKLPAVSAKTTGYDAKGIPVDSGRLRQSIRSKKIHQLAAGVSPIVFR